MKGRRKERWFKGCTHAERGWTIVQTMVALLIAGIVLYLAAEIVIGKRCEAEPARPMCVDR